MRDDRLAPPLDDRERERPRLPWRKILAIALPAVGAAATIAWALGTGRIEPRTGRGHVGVGKNVGKAAREIKELRDDLAEKIPAAIPVPTPSGGSGRPALYKSLPSDDAVLVWIEVSPRRATLILDGEPAPSNPLRLPRGNDRYKIIALADGFAPAEAEFVADGPKTVRIALTRAAADR